ncbi:MAG: response regulator [bacterium]|nr:response regulator [bacterium]
MSNEVWALVVEDDAHNLIAITSLLKELDIRYKRNTTGAKVAEQIDSMHPRPAFVLLDMDLPEGDAISIAQEIRRNPYTAHIPVVAISEQFTNRFRQRHRDLGFTAFLLKPLPRNDFKEIVANLIGTDPTSQEPKHQ